MARTVPHGFNRSARRCAAAPAVSLALCVCLAVPAAAQEDELITRPAGWQPLPVAKPSISESFASTCQPVDPELAWFRLPQQFRSATVEEMIGQLLVVSYGGTRPDDAGVAAARDAIARSRIGGVLTFRHNIASAGDIAAVNRSFMEARPDLPPIIAVDQEGGLVMRVKPSEGAPSTPAAADIAAGSEDEARAAYDDMAAALATLGFNANFGPVVDLASNPDNPVIARFGRSFGADPATVTDYATVFAEAHRAAGIGTALKHFPGHGSSTDDSHEGAIDLTATWSRQEMLPFRDMIASGEADMLMAGHLTLKGVTEADIPASLSQSAITGFLRETLCYDGVVVSDDLAMDAVSSRWDAVEAVTMMVEAGGDLALLSLGTGQGYEVIDAISSALAEHARQSPEFAAKIRQAYARIANLKLDLTEWRPSPLSTEIDTAGLP
ncbi:glycoside hydrolase family 3 N-terminal domain-containing protein [Acuticoccus yangtzensis]|uniref:glycoside hydrolase family 3 N-terminal domain-containing protein n=1 Tax=Acuticoccus yangtzensis TaxID=1443441 RepID=UPI0009F9DED0|nr:glycoside hydrolase family 3 N-terminal domain-containing protein [Acuticoccus yangtzensis]